MYEDDDYDPDDDEYEDYFEGDDVTPAVPLPPKPPAWGNYNVINDHVGPFADQNATLQNVKINVANYVDLSKLEITNGATENEFAPIKGTQLQQHWSVGEARHHRSLVVVDISAYNQIRKDWAERIPRYVRSFNHDQTMKADIVAICANRLYGWAWLKESFVSETFNVPQLMFDDAKKLVSLDFDGLNKFAAKREYSLISVVTVPGRTVKAG